MSNPVPALHVCSTAQLLLLSIGRHRDDSLARFRGDDIHFTAFPSLLLVLTGFICEGYLKIKPAVGEENFARESSEPQGKEARDPTKEEERMRRFFNIASQLHHDAQCYLMKVGFGAKKLNPSMRLINDVVAYWSDED